MTRQGDSDSAQCESAVYWGLFYLEAMEVDEVMTIEIDCQGAHVTLIVEVRRCHILSSLVHATSLVVTCGSCGLHYSHQGLLFL
jgi:hypothetical protein